MKPPLSYCSKIIASHSRSFAFDRPILTSPRLYSPDDDWFVFTYRRSVWRLSRSTSSWFNEKVDAKTNENLTEKYSTDTFKDTASAASRDRTLCLGPLVRYLYISHWSRVVGPSPPFYSYHLLLRTLREEVHLSLLFSYFSAFSLSLFFFFVSHFQTFCLSFIILYL